MGKSILYTPLFQSSRSLLIDKCIDVMGRGKKFIYIVPSREVMFEVRNAIIEKFGGLLNTTIITFSDLSRLIAGEFIDGCIIDEDSIFLILDEALQQLCKGNRLKCFDKVCNSEGFVRILYKVIKRLKRSNVRPDDFKTQYEDMCSKNNNLVFKTKCEDIYQIYNLYNEILRDKGLYDVDDISLIAMKNVKESYFFEDVELLIVDGYINIDVLDKLLMENIVDSYENIDFAVNIPFNNGYIDEFVSEEIIKDFVEMGFSMEDEDFEDCSINENIKLASTNLFSKESNFIKGSKGIKILNAPCIENEVRQTAKVIKRKLMNGVKASDIAIYLNNIEDYESAFEKVFSEYEIPVNLTFRKPILSNNLTRDIIDLLRLGESFGNLDRLINICSSKYFGEKSGSDKILDTSLLKGGVVENLKNLKNVLEGLTPEQRISNYGYGVEDVTQILSFIVETELLLNIFPEFDKLSGFVDKTIKLIRQFKINHNIINSYKNGEMSSSKFVEDIKALSLLESFLENLKQSYITSGMDYRNIAYSKFLNILENGLMDCMISKNEADLSGVKIINPELARGQAYDTVFILGANEGIMPAPPDKASIFDYREVNQLFHAGINLNHHIWELKREKIRFNLSCATAKNELYLSYRTADEDGNYMIKSSFVEDFESLFDNETLKDIKSDLVYMRERFEEKAENTLTKEEVVDNILGGIWQYRKDVDDLIEISGVSKEYEDFDDINRAGMVEFSRNLSPEFDNYDGLLTNPKHMQSEPGFIFSASQIDEYAKCAFKYFMDRSLGLSTFEEDEELSLTNIGSLYHDVLRNYYSQEGNESAFNENWLNKCIEEALKKIKNTRYNEIIFEAKKREIKQKLSEFINKDITFNNGYFEKTQKRMKPVFLEEGFKLFDTYKSANFRGQIDRIDLEVDEEGRYTGKFIIYDYKRSSISKLEDCLTGNNFQLAIYYYAVIEMLKKKLGIEKPECIALIYYSVDKKEREGIIREEYKKNIGFTAVKTSLANDPFFAALEWIKIQTEDIAEKIMEGNFTLPYECPAQAGGYDCEYSQVCRFNKYRIAGKRQVGQ